MEEEHIKNELLEVIAFAYRRVKHDRCTYEEMESMLNILSENMTLWASTKELAKHYGQTESNVRNVVARNYIPREQRSTGMNLLNFRFFSKIKPSSWRHGKGV